MKFRSFFLTLTLLPLVAFAAPGGVGSSLQKGLVGHWPLTGESEKTSDNLIINGTFDVDTNWVKQTGWSISGGIGNFDASVMGYIKQLGVYRIGVKSILKFDVVGSNDARLGLSNTGIATILYAPGTHVLEFTPTAEDMIIWGYAGFPPFSIDNISVKELKTADATPYDNHGTIYGATSTTGLNGETDGAMSFDGVSDYVSVTGTSQLPIGTSPRTFSFWMKPTITQNKIIMGYGTNGVSQLWDFMLVSGKVGIHFYNSDPSVDFPNTIYTVGQWQHVLFTYDGTSVKSYINGVLKDTKIKTLNTIDSGTLKIGNGIFTSYNYFDGALRNLLIYNRALTADEVAQLYNQGGKTVVTQKPSLETGLVGHWPLNRESEAWTELTGDDWQNSTAYGRTAGTNYFSQAGNTIEVVNTGSSWFGAGKMYATSEKGKYKIHIKTNTFNGLLKPAFHLYNAGSRVSYTAAQVPTTPTFTSNHASGFNYASKSTGPYEATDIIDLTNAPDFDAIHVALLSESGTSSPYIQFQSTDIFVKQLVTADTTPYDNHGKINGATLTTGPREETNGAMGFDGDQDAITVISSPNLIISGDLTLSAWVKNGGSGSHGIAGKMKEAPYSGFGITKQTNLFKFWTANSSYSYTQSNTTYIDENWHHIVGVRNSGTNYLYVDGILQTDSDISPLVDSGQDFVIGRYYSNNETNYEWDGNISSVRLYNRALTTQEITQLYQEKAKLMGNKVPSLESGLVGHWPLSGGYTNPSVFADITPYDNHGTFYGTTLTTGIHGEAGGARSFNGTSDYILSNSNLDALSSFSISSWVNLNTIAGSWKPIVHNGLQINSGLMCTINGGKLSLLIPNGAYEGIAGSIIMNTDTWYHTVCTFDGTNGIVYVNGINDGQSTFIKHSSGGDNITIGASKTSEGAWSNTYFPGALSDVRVYNRALSADEVKRLYEVR